MTRIDRAEAHFTTMIASSLARGPEGVVVPPAILRPLIGGIWFVARTRFLEARPRDVAAGGVELREWLLAFRSPATSQVPALTPRRSDRVPGPTEDDGEASERVRMLRAATAVVARGGYPALSVGEVVEAAGLDETGFTAQFGNIRDCFLDLLDWLSTRALVDALRASEGAPTWAAGVCRAVEAVFCRLAGDPGLARAAFLDVFATGPVGAARLAALLRCFAEALVRQAPAAARPSPLVAEAIVGAVWSIAHRHIVRGRRTRLPASCARASFVILAPILGPEAALAVIVSERDRRLLSLK
jgi:AcrR family transcriptional regulator